MNKKKSKSSKPKAAGKLSKSPLDLGLLQTLIKVMESHHLSTLELRDGERQVALKRGPTEAVQMVGAGAAPAGAGAAAPAADAGLLPIKSPMVGTFYSKASPDAKPLVAVGTQVDEDTDVCVIEAMKVFNNIKAECRGSIAKILVGDGETVEHGTVLFLVKPA